jgi:hypothetical protein
MALAVAELKKWIDTLPENAEVAIEQGCLIQDQGSKACIIGGHTFKGKPEGLFSSLLDFIVNGVHPTDWHVPCARCHFEGRVHDTIESCWRYKRPPAK